MIQKRLERRPFSTHSRTAAMGKTTVLAQCPFCGATAVIFVWSFAGSGRKNCPCGATFTNRDNGTSEKLVEIAP